MFEPIPQHSRWHSWERRLPPDFWTEKTFQRIAELKSIAHQSGHSLPSIAMAWLLKASEVNTVITGPRVPAHLRDVELARNHPLSQESFDKIAKLFGF